MKSTLASLLLSGRNAAALLALSLLAACAGGETTSTTEGGLPVCGDGLVTGAEECDDANTAPGDGCNDICEIERNFDCSGEPSSCVDLRGDTGTGDTSADTGADTSADTTVNDTGADTAVDTGADTGTDTAVDTGADTGTDTTADTTVDDTTADTAPDTTVDTTPDTTPPPICGDGTVAAGEGCDDGNLVDGDGCSDICVVEATYACSGSPSLCVVDLCAGVSCGGLAGSCEVATCNPATGLCEVRDDADGAACSDGNLCTTGDVCTAGLCAGSAVVCADSGGGCTTGICNPGTGACEGVAQPDCTACAGGGFCAGGECGGLPQTPAYTFESATDAAAFTMSGNQPWRIDATTAHTGTSSLRSGNIGSSQTSTATLTVNLRAAAQLRLWVKASSEGCCDKLSLTTNGALDGTTWAGTVNWTEVVRNLPAGPSTLAFTYTKDSSSTGGTDTVWIDDLTISAETTDSCTTGTCGEAIFNGTDCLVCAPVSDGTTCDTDASDCTAESCQAGSCVAAPIADGTTCDTGAECTVGSCAAGSCVTATAPDCTACGAGGLCGGGTCQGASESTTYAYGAGSTLAPFTTAAPAWARDASQGNSAGGALKSGTTPNSGSSVLTYTHTGASRTYSFWYKVSSEGGFDYLTLKLDGVQVVRWSGEVAWTQYTGTLPAGSHTLTLTYSKDSGGTAGSDAAWIDDVVFSDPNNCAADACGAGVSAGGSCVSCDPAPDGTACDSDASPCTAQTCQAGSCVAAPVVDGTVCPSSGECSVGACAAGSCVTSPAPDCTACGAGGLCGGGTCQGAAESTTYAYGAGSTIAPFTTAAPAWAIDAAEGHSAGGALKSGTTPNSGSSILTFTTSGASRTYAFWYKVSSESGFDFLTLKLDGVLVVRWSGTVAWTQYTGTIPAGSHTLTLTYSKDGAGTAGSDAGWIDDVEFSDPNNCSANVCGSGVSSGGSCAACEPVADGTACDSDASPCTAQSCQAGSCVTEPVVDGTSCDSDATDCTVSACQAGSCISQNADNCADCGATGTGTCGDGTCFGPSESRSFSYGTGATLTPFTTGTPAWRIDAAEGRSAGGALRAGVTADGGSSLLTYAHTGPARPYSFWYKVSSEATYDYLSLKLDGVLLQQWSGTVAWTQYSGTLPAGNHTLTLTYSKDVSGTAGSDTAWVDDVTFSDPNSCASNACSAGVPVGGSCFACFVQPDGTDCDSSATDCILSSCQSGSCVAANEADCASCGNTATGTCGNGLCRGPDESSFSTSFAAGSALAPLTSTAPAWAIDTTQGYAGGSALKSGVTPNSGSSTVTLVTTTVAGQGLSFWYKVSSEATWDVLRFKVDGVTRGEWSGAGVWTQFTSTLTAGSHTLVWEYSKDGSSALGSDAGWIDELRITSPNLCGDDCSLSVDSGAGCIACAPPADDCTACNGGTEVCIAGNCGGLGNTSVVETFESATWPAAFTAPASTTIRWASSASVPAPGAGQGLRSAKSGAIGSTASTAFQRTFTVGTGGSLAFKYRVSSEPTYDLLKVTVDGTEVLSASGTVAWTDFTRALTAGNHTVVWTYSKDGSGTGGSDAAWVDLITVTDATSCAGDSCGNAGYDGGACLTCDPTACY